jgi:ectoine hydroxylase-related dioxygenase (phytanoyl-CoA dioxygenase family)
MDRAYIDDYRRDGFAIIRGVFTPWEVAELQAAFNRIYTEGQKHPKTYRHGNTLYRISDDPSLGRIMRLMQWPSYFEPVLNRFRLDRRMLAMLEPLIGRDLKQIINQLHWKPPGAAMVEFGYHQDMRFRRPRSAYRNPGDSYLQTGIAVDPHRRENGAMMMIPGSHRLGELAFGHDTQIMHRIMTDDDLRHAGIDPTRAVPLEFDPGDVAIWHLYCVHGSGPNLSAVDRRLYINGYVSAESCDRGEWAFRDGEPCELGEPTLVHYEALYERPEPHYVDA